MRKSLIIALVALISSVVVPAAQGDPTLGQRIIAQEKAEYGALMLRSEALNQKYGLGQQAVRQGMTAAEYRALVLRSEALNQKYGLGKAKNVVVQPAAPTPVQQIIAQERGRQRDAGLFGPSSSSPVLVVGPADSFDVRDAGVGSAATLALALLVAAGIAVRGTRRHATAPGS